MLIQAVSSASTKRGTVNWIRAALLFCSRAHLTLTVFDCKNRYYSMIADKGEEDLNATGRASKKPRR